MNSKRLRFTMEGERKRELRLFLVWLLVWTMLLPVFGLQAAYADGLTGDPPLVDESFESMTVGSTPSGWGVSATGDSYVQVKQESSGNHYLQIYDASQKNTQGIQKSFASQTGRVTIEALVQLPPGGTSGKENVLFYVLDSTGKAGVALNLMPTRILSYRTVGGATTSSTLAQGLAMSSWQHIIVSADVSAKTFDFYLNGSLAAAGVPFRYDDVTSLSRLQVTGAYYNETSNPIRVVNLDSVKIYTGDVRLLTPPALSPDTTSAVPGQPIELTFTDDAAWRAAITKVTVDNATVAASVYAASTGKLSLDASLFPDGKTYTIAVQADGYLTTTVQQVIYADLLNETFTSMALGSTPSGWGVSVTGDSYVKVQEKLDGDRYLQIYDASRQNTQGITKAFSAQSGTFTIQADVQLPDGATAGKENMLFYVNDTTGKTAVALNLLPTKITSFRTVGTTTTTTDVATSLSSHAWRNLAIAIHPETVTYDVYVDGTLKKSAIPFRYDGTVNLSSLRVSGAYYGDAANYVRIANLDNVRIYQGMPELPEAEQPVAPPAPGTETNSFDSYSSVFLSSRWWRTDGQDGQLGTLDVLKRFMATDDKWTYLTEQDKISNIVRLGVGFQGSLNMNNGSGGRAKYYDGTDIVAPWMTWGATWGSMSDPVYYNQVLATAKSAIDAGASSFQFDDWVGSVDAYKFGGDFCAPCMTGFRDYLEEHYTTSELSGFGIDNIATFNYKTFLQTTLDVETNADYMTKKALTPLDNIFGAFMKQEAISFHTRMREDMETYAGRPIEYSNNASFIRDASTQTHFIHDLFDYGMGEHNEGAMSLNNIVTNGTIASGLGKPHIMSPLPFQTGNIRQSLAAAYALGQYMLVPWDAWLEGSTRYFGTVEQYGEMFHFIRQYPFLFDGHEPPAKVGILLKWNELNGNTLTDLSMKLFKAGVPFRTVTANDSLPHYDLRAQTLEGLDTLIAYSPVSSFDSDDQQRITDTEADVVSVPTIDATWLANHSAVSVSVVDQVYAIVRSSADANAPKSVHLLNRKGESVSGAKVTLTDADFFGGASLQAVLYRPGQDPLPLAVTSAGSGKHELTVPELAEWGILRIGSGTAASLTAEDDFAVQAPWSGLAIGNPTKGGGVTVSGATYQLASKGRGLHVPVTGDNGSMDQFSYVYRHVDATPLQNYELSVKLEPTASETSGALSGLMVRETTASNAKFVAAAYVEGSGWKLYWRDEDNGQVGAVNLDVSATSGYLKLAREGGRYHAYYSADGVTYGASLGSHELSMRTLLGGGFAAAGKQASEFTASLTGLALNYGGLTLPPGELTEVNLSGLPDPFVLDASASLTVSASFNDNGTVTEADITGEHIVFTSSDPAVATVNADGVVHAVSVGETTVTAQFTVGGVTVTGTLAVEVTLADPVLLDESFDSYGETDVPLHWTYKPVLDGGSYIKIAEFPSATDKSLNIYDNTGGSFPSATAEFVQQKRTVTIDFDFRINLGTNPATGGAIAVYVQSQGSANAVSLLADQTGFWYLDGTQTVVAAPLASDQWYAVRLVVNPQTQKMDMYLDGTQVVSQGNFRQTADDITKIMVGGSTTGVNTQVYWNNVKVTAGTPE